MAGKSVKNKKKKCFGGIFTAILCGLLCACGQNGKNESSSQPAFIKGADISALEAVEDYGGVFYDFEGKETDVIEFLMDNGCNYFRLRVWNNPTKSFDAGDYCSPEHTLEMAKRIKKAGGSYLLDFHYSDWWADPKNQAVPEAWKGMDKEELIAAVYDFTSEMLKDLAKAGAYPDMVQIGNEIRNGMLWNYGTTDDPETLAALINSGIAAVRDTTPKGQETKIMIHVQDGGYVKETEEFFTMLEKNGVTDYDIVGLSYYPYWHGTFADLKENINNIYNTFGKEVVVAETAYPFTNENGDDKRNLVTNEDLKEVGFEASVENQKRMFELVMNTVATSSGGLGAFYWEPAWLAVEGAGVAKGSGNEWENQALFDFEGRALESVKAFGFEPGSVDNDEILYVYPLAECEADQNATEEELAEELPKTAKALYMDGTIREVEIAWDISSKKILTDTRVIFQGMAGENEVSVCALLGDKYAANNLSFEEGTTGWIIEGDTAAGWASGSEDGCPHEGNGSFSYWYAGAFTLDVYQYVKVSESGQYNLESWSEGKGNTKLLLTLYIADENGKKLDSESFQNTGWAEWKNPCVTANLEEGDIVRIGMKIQGVADDWGAIDDFKFYAVQ